MHRKLKLIHRNGTGNLYFVQPITKDFNQIITDLPVENTNSTFSDPRLEVNFYSLDCDKLRQLKSDIENYLITVRLMPEGTAYYNAKLAELDSVIQTQCRVTILPPPKITDPGPDSGPAPDPTPAPDPPPKKPDVVVKPSGLPGVTVNVGDTSSLSPTPGGAAGGGGGGGGSKPADKKKSNLWLWIVCIGALGLSLYKGRSSTIKMPG